MAHQDHLQRVSGMQELPSLQDTESSISKQLSKGITESASGQIKTAVHDLEELKSLYEIDAESGVLRQKDLTVQVKYDADYVTSRYDQYPRSKEMAELRADLLFEHCDDVRTVLDFGCGNGDFIKAVRRPHVSVVGWDISGYQDDFLVLSEWLVYDSAWSCVTFFDSLEHLVNPMDTIRRLKTRFVMVSVPWCLEPDEPGFWEWFSKWKHRRYGEHLWHFNTLNLSRMMYQLGFETIYHGWPEDAIRGKSDDGCFNILTAIFRKR